MEAVRVLGLGVAAVGDRVPSSRMFGSAMPRRSRLCFVDEGRDVVGGVLEADHHMTPGKLSNGALENCIQLVNEPLPNLVSA